MEKVDYTFWVRADKWKTREAACLFLGLNPNKPYEDDYFDKDKNVEIENRIDNMHELIYRGIQVNTIQGNTYEGCPVAPFSVMEWAYARKIDFPERLLEAFLEIREYVPGMREQQRTQPPETERRLTTNQRDRIRCQVIAQLLWAYEDRSGNPRRNRKEIIASDEFVHLCLPEEDPEKYSLETLERWLGEVDDRPAEKKRGPNKSSVTPNRLANHYRIAAE